MKEEYYMLEDCNEFLKQSKNHAEDLRRVSNKPDRVLTKLGVMHVEEGFFVIYFDEETKQAVRGEQITAR